MAAGAVVTKSFPDFSIIGGVPAAILRSRLRERDCSFEVRTIGDKSPKLHYCLDGPKTGVLDECHPFINGWIASINGFDSISLSNDSGVFEINDFHKRPDVENYMKTINKAFTQSGDIIGFRLGPLVSTSLISVIINGESSAIFEVVLGP